MREQKIEKRGGGEDGRRRGMEGERASEPKEGMGERKND